MRALDAEEVQYLIDAYTPADLGLIAYAPKGGGTGFDDENLEHRQQVIEAVLQALAAGSDRHIPVLLLRDLFVQDSLCARDAFGIGRNYHLLAQAFLEAADGSLIDDFLLGYSASFDTSLSCGRVRLPAAIIAKYLHNLEDMSAAAPDKESRERYQAAHGFFSRLRPREAEA